MAIDSPTYDHISSVRLTSHAEADQWLGKLAAAAASQREAGLLAEQCDHKTSTQNDVVSTRDQHARSALRAANLQELLESGCR